MSWFTREEVRMQLAGLGYTDVSEDTLEDFYAGTPFDGLYEMRRTANTF